MSDDLYRRCVDQITDMNLDTELWLADHGESLLIGESIIEKVRYAKRKGLRRVFVNSNGMLLTQQISRGLIDAGLDAIFFGVDAISKKTHAAIRC